MHNTAVRRLHNLQRVRPEKPGAPLRPRTAQSASECVHCSELRSSGEKLIWLFFSWQQLELVEPSGWIHVPLTDNHKKPTRTFMIQIAVLANHQNGRDTHMRQIKVYTPVEESSVGKFPRCTTIDFMMYRSIRWPGPGPKSLNTSLFLWSVNVVPGSFIGKASVILHFRVH